MSPATCKTAFGLGLAILFSSLSPLKPLTAQPADAAPAQPAATTARSMDALDSTRILEPGDVISFRVLEEGDPPAMLQVSPNGEVDMPLIGRIRASGLTSRDLAYRAKRELEKEFYRTATVIIGLERPSTESLGVVYVNGQVLSQGPLEIPRGIEFTVSKAILHAGGFADFADRRRVRLIRPGGEGEKAETIRVDVKEILERGRLDKDVAVQPGDYIFVPERAINF